VRVEECNGLTRWYLGQEAYEGLKGNEPPIPNVVDVVIQKRSGYVEC
jgi:hypothetical protein